MESSLHAGIIHKASGTNFCSYCKRKVISANTFSAYVYISCTYYVEGIYIEQLFFPPCLSPLFILMAECFSPPLCIDKRAQGLEVNVFDIVSYPRDRKLSGPTIYLSKI